MEMDAGEGSSLALGWPPRAPHLPLQSWRRLPLPLTRAEDSTVAARLSATLALRSCCNKQLHLIH